METKKIFLSGILFFLLLYNALAQTTTVNGLVVVVNFKDYKLKATMAELEDMFNKTSGFDLWGNNTSVREYFRVQTNNKIDLVNTIISVDLDENSSYYVGNGAPGDLSNDVIDAINQKYSAGFTGLTNHPTQGRLYNFSLISQSAAGAGVAWEVWPNRTITNNGQDMVIRNISHVSWTSDYDYDVNTICHEYGHSVWNWTDFYRTAFCNLGMFDLMSSAGSDAAPMPINPALRLQRGWVDTITNVPGDVTATYTLSANSYSRVYRYLNPNNPKEYLIFHALKHDKFYQSSLHGTPTPEGLAIWYVDEDMGYGLSGQDNQFTIRLVQADNKDEMHDEDATGHVGGDMDDLYGNTNTSFPNGHPWRWKDGGEFGIQLSNITKSGNNVSFTVLGRARTVLAGTDMNGTISPKGTLNVAGTSQSFTFTPDPGYELAAITVDELPVPTANPYLLTNINGTKTIQGYFERKTNLPALPSPWQKAHVGVTGIAAHETGLFGLEADGGAMGPWDDYFSFAYQTLNGNGTIIARVASVNRPAQNHRAGIMIRASLASNAAHTKLVKVPYDAQRVEQRLATGDRVQENPNGVQSLHVFNLYNWMKITRTGNEFISYCSRDGVNWIPLGQQTITMPAQVLIGLFVAGGVQYFPAKATFDNVSITTTGDQACTFTGTKITGSSIGSTGSYNNSGATREKAFDGNIFNYFDAATDQAWTGLELAAHYKVSGIRYFPRREFTGRMVGGKFQGSNSADFSSGVVDLATITTEPVYGYNCISVSDTASFKYLRYLSPADGWGNVSEVEFYGTQEVANIAPSVSILNPAASSTFNAPATISITANATDQDGTISKVEFFNGSTLLGTVLSAPYTYSWTNVPAGTYSITAKATDNNGATALHTVSDINVVNPSSPVSGPSCASNNTTVIYELAAAQRVNATGYNWYYNGSAQSIAPMSGTPYKAYLTTGSNFSSGQVCVGVNYSSAPWYASYCSNVSKCPAREGVSIETAETAAASHPNPFSSETTITMPDASQPAKIQVYNVNGTMVEEAEVVGEFKFGNSQLPGIYLVKIITGTKTSSLRIVKQ